MRLLVRVVERQSFSAAASDLGLPRSSATTAIKQFEERLGVRLLRRTTRHVAPTLEGEIYYLHPLHDRKCRVDTRRQRPLVKSPGIVSKGLLKQAADNGLLLSVTADTVIRMVPSLILTTAEADEIVAILCPLIRQFLQQHATAGAAA